jgi:hypothetical protein
MHRPVISGPNGHRIIYSSLVCRHAPDVSAFRAAVAAFEGHLKG